MNPASQRVLMEGLDRPGIALGASRRASTDSAAFMTRTVATLCLISAALCLLFALFASPSGQAARGAPPNSVSSRPTAGPTAAPSAAARVPVHRFYVLFVVSDADLAARIEERISRNHLALEQFGVATGSFDFEVVRSDEDVAVIEDGLRLLRSTCTDDCPSIIALDLR